MKLIYCTIMTNEQTNVQDQTLSQKETIEQYRHIEIANKNEVFELQPTELIEVHINKLVKINESSFEITAPMDASEGLSRVWHVLNDLTCL